MQKLGRCLAASRAASSAGLSVPANSFSRSSPWRRWHMRARLHGWECMQQAGRAGEQGACRVTTWPLCRRHISARVPRAGEPRAQPVSRCSTTPPAGYWTGITAAARCSPEPAVQAGKSNQPAPAARSRVGDGPAADHVLQVRLCGRDVGQRLQAGGRGQVCCSCRRGSGSTVGGWRPAGLTPQLNSSPPDTAAHLAGNVAGAVDDLAPHLACLIPPSIAGVGAAGRKARREADGVRK